MWPCRTPSADVYDHPGARPRDSPMLMSPAVSCQPQSCEGHRRRGRSMRGTGGGIRVWTAADFLVVMRSNDAGNQPRRPPTPGGESPMIPLPKRLFGAAVAFTLVAVSPALAQPLELKLMAPAAPGGGWDQTARSMQQALVAAGIARSVQVTNVPGAGGSVGIAQFVNGAKGDGSQMMVNGFVMVGALAMNKSPVTLDQVTPIARLTEEIQVIVVPANSPLKTAQDLAAAVKADIAKVTFAGGSAGGVAHVIAALFAGAVGP